MTCDIYNQLVDNGVVRGGLKCPHDGMGGCVKTVTSCKLGATLVMIDRNARIEWEDPEDLEQDKVLKALEEKGLK